MRPKVQVDSFEADKGKVAVVLNDKSKVVADHVVVAVGINPSVVSIVSVFVHCTSLMTCSN